MSSEHDVSQNCEVGVKYIGCKFTVESREGLGGDWERNTGGATEKKRITFDGYATEELYAALMDAVKEVTRQ